MAIVRVWIDPSVFAMNKLSFSLSNICGRTVFCLFVLILFKQGQNDAAKIRTGDSGVYQ